MNATVRDRAFGYNANARDAYDFERYFRRSIMRKKARKLEAFLRALDDPSFDELHDQLETAKWGAFAAALRLKGDREHAQVFHMESDLARSCQQDDLGDMRFDDLVFPYDRFMLYVHDPDVIRDIWGHDWKGGTLQAMHIYVERVCDGKKVVLTAATDTPGNVPSFGPVSFSAATMQTQALPFLSEHLNAYTVTELDRVGGRLFKFVASFLSLLEGGGAAQQLSHPRSQPQQPQKGKRRHGSRTCQVTYLRRSSRTSGAGPKTTHASPKEHWVRSHIRRIPKSDGSGFKHVRVRAHKRGTKPTGRSGPRKYVVQ